MLSPPIAIHRAEFELSGVGKAVQVREVSQSAQDNVSAGYNALVRGAYDMALGFYDRALKSEPTSVLALLGHGAALQKLGKPDEARADYERVLKVDPSNREALSNLTVIALFSFSPGMQIWAKDVLNHMRGTLSAGPAKSGGLPTAAAAAPQ